MADRGELMDRLTEIVSEAGQIPAARVTGRARLVEDLDLDSLSLTEIAEASRETWRVSLPIGTMRGFETVDHVLDEIERQLR